MILFIVIDNLVSCNNEENMLPVIALVGRPNVGKSTLFNALTKTRDALVADQPGLTRDRQYGTGRIGGYAYMVVDTGGLSGEAVAMDHLIAHQAWHAIHESDVIVFMVDGRAGCTAVDEEIAVQLRRTGKPVILVINKVELQAKVDLQHDFFHLAFDQHMMISAAHRQGLAEVMAAVYELLPDSYKQEEQQVEEDDEKGKVRLMVFGRPNVGKSTLINAFLGEERVVASEIAGTTRDAIEIPFEHKGQMYTLIDTAGVRRRSRVDDKIEKFSVIKSLQALERAHVVLFLMDAQEGITDQDASLLGHVLEAGRALVLLVNKWDHLSADHQARIKDELARKLSYVDFTEPLFISARYGQDVLKVLEAARKAYQSAVRKFSTNELTQILEYALHEHQPPLYKGYMPKLRYAHQGGKNPPCIIIHGNRVQHIKESYRRYLVNFFRQQLKITGTPIRIEFKANDNPYVKTS